MRVPTATPSVLALAVLLACGGSGSEKAPEPSAPRVSVALREAGAPVVGAKVVFHRPGGSVQQVAVSDAHGEASAVLAEGGLVTVVVAHPGPGASTYLSTIAGVRPGDELHLGLDDVGRITGAATLTFPAAVDGAEYYGVDASCTRDNVAPGELQPTPAFPLWSTCGASIDALAIAHGAVNAPLAWATAIGVPVTGEPPSQAAAVALGAWRTDFDTLAVDLTHAPPESCGTGATLTLLRDGKSFDGSLGDASGIRPGESLSLAIPFPPAFASAGHLETSLGFGRCAAEDGVVWIAERGIALAPRTVDLAAALPPRLHRMSLARVDGALVASWSQAADPAFDVTVVTTGWTSASGGASWVVVLPPGTTSFTFPPLPSELAGAAPPPGEVPPTAMAGAYDVAEAQGYDAFRALTLDLLGGVFMRLNLTTLRGTEAHAPAMAAPAAQAAAPAR